MCTCMDTACIDIGDTSQKSVGRQCQAPGYPAAIGWSVMSTHFECTVLDILLAPGLKDGNFSHRLCTMLGTVHTNYGVWVWCGMIPGINVSCYRDTRKQIGEMFSLWISQWNSTAPVHQDVPEGGIIWLVRRNLSKTTEPVITMKTVFWLKFHETLDIVSLNAYLSQLWVAVYVWRDHMFGSSF